MALVDVARQLTGKIVVALITLFIGFILAQIVGRLVKRVLSEAEINRVLAKAGMKLDSTIGQIIEYIIYTITLLVILQQFGLTKLVFAIVIFLVALLLGFSLALAIKDFIPNAITGFFIRKKLKRQIGKNVRIGIVSGKLMHVGIVDSIVKDKEIHRVPHLYTSKCLQNF